MKISIIGASQGIGKQLLELALEEGNEVTALLRNPNKLQITNSNLHILKGDILDPSSVANATADQDAICVCIGIPPSRKPVEVFSKGIKNVLASIGNNTEQKLIVITGIGAGDSKGHGGFLYDRVFNPLLLKEIYRDKDREEALIKESHANWLIVRPGFLTNGPRTGKYRVIDNLTGVTAGKISRADVADFMLKQLMEPTHFGKTPLLTY
ncbi:MAG: SDR family oxidoreductase [Gammaproteobacteria bacterium]|nr:SDR family oxidoreductase [Gammaproteobacteria bacterium]